MLRHLAAAEPPPADGTSSRAMGSPRPRGPEGAHGRVSVEAARERHGGCQEPDRRGV